MKATIIIMQQTLPLLPDNQIKELMEMGTHQTIKEPVPHIRITL